MSTATTGRPVGDNEFPVLLRLPDLNATAWLPMPSPTVSSTTPAEVTAAPTMWTAPVEIPTVAPATPMAATTSVDVTATTTAAVAAQATTRATVTVPPRSERISRLERATPAQWTLIRQLATGGVLVGGLALTYFMIMGGGETETPEHITAAETTLEPPLIETPANLVAVDANRNATPPKPSNEPASNAIAAVPPPPDFKPFSAEPAMPSHIVVAEKPESSPAPMTGLPGGAPNPAVQNAGRDNVGTYRGQIGPNAPYASAAPAPTYPTTHPSTFIYRQIDGNPQSEAARTARLQGTIAPPPLR